jgi:drug/metabolite transporter (DMT)-like permease
MKTETDMSVPAAYLGVILIWTTTPLAIKWSGEGTHFLFGLFGRMAIGAVLCLALALLLRVPLPRHRRALHIYLASGLGIWGGMSCVYWGARFIPSGWIAVIFGLTPVITGALATFVLRERGLTPPRLAGMALGLVGLVTIFGKGASLGPQALWGIAAIVLASAIQSGSAVWLKRLDTGLSALAVTAGGLLVATALIAATWLLAGAQWPAQVPPRAAWAILYLGVGGSVVGFFLYFYVLQRLEATKVALITLVTPVSALLLGRILNGEPLSMAVAWGTAAILSGLLLVQFGDRWRRSMPKAAPGVSLPE